MKKIVLIILFAAFVTGQAQTGLCFTPTVNYTTGIGYPTSVAASDFNGDGNKDLAVANFSGIVTIFLGDNLGNFTMDTSYNIGNNTNTIISTDFNLDGKADIAILNNGNNTINAMLGNGTARFTLSTTFGIAGNNPYSLIQADFNSDNKPDLAWVNETNKQVAVALGNGAGNFSSPFLNMVGNAPNGVTSADFNSDGKADLAVANNSDTTISVLYGDGSGGFSAANNFSSGPFATRITNGDFNADGKIDLAITNQLTAKFAILLGNGVGGFSNPLYFISGTAPYAIASSDFNGDGVADIVTTSSFYIHDKIITISLGIGNGFFSPGINFTVGSQPNSVIGLDLNNDGRGDIVVTDGYSDSLSVLISCLASGVNFLPNKTSKINIYPNPSNDGKITITVNGNIDEIKVVNTLGQTVYDAKPNSEKTTLQINNVGIYFVTITSGKDVSTKKIIVTN